MTSIKGRYFQWIMDEHGNMNMINSKLMHVFFCFNFGIIIMSFLFYFYSRCYKGLTTEEEFTSGRHS